MTTRTFIVNNLFNEFTLFHTEIPYTTLVGHPDISKVGAAWVLWNGSTDQLIKVKNFKITNQISQGNTIQVGAINIDRISGYTECAYTGSMSNVTKFDSLSPDLPSGVSIKTRVDSANSTSTMRSFINLRTMNFTRALGLMCAKRVGAGDKGFNTAIIQACGYGNSEVQGVVLREGEGLALEPIGVQFSVGYRITFIFNIDGHTYSCGESIRPFAELVPALIFNEVGSGVTINIVQIECRELGSDDMCNFAIQKIDGIQNQIYSSETTNTIVSTDSTQTLPSGIKMYEDCLVDLQGSKQGAIITNPSFMRNLQQAYGVGPGLAGVRLSGLTSSSELFATTTAPIVLRPGEGLALFQKTAAGSGRYGASILFQTEDLPSTGTPVKVYSYMT